jgi:F420-non-reducing hydrogenase iron-sulfur subunit
MEYMGIERDRLHMSWVSSAEATKFIDVVTAGDRSGPRPGPQQHFVKQQAKVA